MKLAVSRARATGAKAIFWLNPARAHDANVIALAHKYLAEHDVEGKYSSFMYTLYRHSSFVCFYYKTVFSPQTVLFLSDKGLNSQKWFTNLLSGTMSLHLN